MLPVLRERCGHRDHEDVGGRGLGRGLEQPALDHCLHQPVEIDLLDMYFAAVDRVDDALRHIDTMHRAARARDNRGRRQADIAETDDADVGLGVTTHECVSLNLWATKLAGVGKFYSNDKARAGMGTDHASASRSAIRAAECPSPNGLCARAIAA